MGNNEKQKYIKVEDKDEAKEIHEYISELNKDDQHDLLIMLKTFKLAKEI